LYPFAHRLSLPWRTGELPAYLLLPEDSANPAGVVVLLNGVTISKEETFSWSRAYLRQGFAVVLLDSPGTGEATQIAPYSADHVDILDGVFELVHEQPNLDPRRVAVIGTSMGGNQAIRALGYDRRLLAAVTVTPAYDPARWMRRASPLLLQQVLSLVGDDLANLEELAFNFALDDVAGRIRKPVLVFGGGRDVIVPPGESQLLAARLGMQGTLVWFADGGHGLYDRIPQWTAESAAWLDAIGRARIGEGFPQPVTEPQELAEIGRMALEAAPHAEEPEPFNEEDIGDYARLVPPEEVRARRAASKPESAEPATPEIDET
jgi:pimeloyl-ACP methyl ester carboxylesterase